MSQVDAENAVRQIAEGINRRDLGAIQAACDPEIEYTSSFSPVEGGKTHRGHLGWSDYLADQATAWEDFRITTEEFVPAEREKLVAVLRIFATARGRAA